MKRFLSHKTFVSFITILFFLITTVYLLAIEASIGEIKITKDYDYQGMTGIYIQVYDVNAYKMKDKKIEFKGQISQNNKLIENLTIKIEPQLVQYDHSVWEGPSIWFFYSYDELEKYKCDIDKEFQFTIFVTNLNGDSSDYIKKDKSIRLNSLTSERNINSDQTKSSEPYPKEIRDVFIESCVEGGGNKIYCECVLEKIEDKYTYEEFSKDKASQKDIEKFAEECVSN